MFNAGMVRPGSKVWIPVNTFDSNDPSASVTATNWANTDCHIHKDGGTTQRASSAGETLSINFDTITGNHLLEIDTADNTTANFYEAGSFYCVRIEGVTVDAGTINAWIGCFWIGYPGAILNTTIATLASQTSFTLEEGAAEADVYNGCPVVIHDLASAVQLAIGYISDYAVTTKTVTLAADPGVFTMAAGDSISIFPPSNVAAWNNTLLATTNPLPNAAADAAGGLPISDAGGLDLDGLNTNVSSVLTDTGTTLDNHLTDIKGTGFAKDTHSLTNIEGYADLIDDGTSGLAKIATDVAAVLTDTGTTLQAEVDGIQADTEDIQSRIPAALVGGRIDATVDATGMEAGAVDNILDETVGDGTLTMRQVLRVLVAGMAGKLSGAATTTITIRNDADTADVIVATVDADGNRSAVTVTP